jgi:hypothetical protein
LLRIVRNDQPDDYICVDAEQLTFTRSTKYSSISDGTASRRFTASPVATPGADALADDWARRPKIGKKG